MFNKIQFQIIRINDSITEFDNFHGGFSLSPDNDIAVFFTEPEERVFSLNLVTADSKKQTIPYSDILTYDFIDNKTMLLESSFSKEETWKKIIRVVPLVDSIVEIQRFDFYQSIDRFENGRKFWYSHDGTFLAFTFSCSIIV